MPTLVEEGAFSSSAKNKINSVLAQFGPSGTTPSATFPDVPGQANNLFYETAQSGITAKAGGGQSGAFQITTQTARVNTVASAGDSVMLPAALAGLEVILINHGANPMQVFGNGTDTIDDVAAGTGVSQMPSSVVIYTCANNGAWYSEGLANGYAGGLQTVSNQDGISAAGNSQGTATVLSPRMAYNVTTVAASTGVQLPPSVSGAELAVANNGANALSIYPATGEKINALATNAAFSAAAGTITILYCFTAGQWYTK